MDFKKFLEMISETESQQDVVDVASHGVEILEEDESAEITEKKSLKEWFEEVEKERLDEDSFPVNAVGADGRPIPGQSAIIKTTTMPGQGGAAVNQLLRQMSRGGMTVILPPNRIQQQQQQQAVQAAELAAGKGGGKRGSVQEEVVEELQDTDTYNNKAVGSLSPEERKQAEKVSDELEAQGASARNKLDTLRSKSADLDPRTIQKLPYTIKPDVDPGMKLPSTPQPDVDPGMKLPSTPSGNTATQTKPAAPKLDVSKMSDAERYGRTGSELRTTSGGQFMTKADRLNQEKVDAILGAGKYKAGTAASNLALRDYFRNQQVAAEPKQPPATDSAPKQPPAKDSLPYTVNTQKPSWADHRRSEDELYKSQLDKLEPVKTYKAISAPTIGVDIAKNLSKSKNPSVSEEWVKKAVQGIQKGALRKQEHKKEGEKFTTAELRNLAKSGTPLERKRAQFALNIRKTDEAQQVDEKFASQQQAKLMYATAGGADTGVSKKVAKEFIKKSKGQKVSKLPKKVKEAEIPSSGPDYGAGLGAGRSDSTLESKKVNESMNQNLKAAYHEGYTHGLRELACRVKHYEDMEEAKNYFEGYKCGLEECYGLETNRGYVGEETAQDVVDNMASYGAVGVEEDAIPTTAGQVVSTTTQPSVSPPVPKTMTAPIQSESDDMDEGNLFTGNLAKARAAGKTMADLDGDGDMEKVQKESRFAFESLDQKLNALLNETVETVAEGVNVSMSQGQGGMHGDKLDDSVSVSATGDDAAKLLAFIKQVGIGGLGGSEASDAEVHADAHPIAAIVSDYGAPKFSGHDDMRALIAKVTGDEEHACNECGMMESGCGCQKKVEETQTLDQSEEMVAEDDGEGDIQADKQGAEIDSALALDYKNSVNESTVIEGPKFDKFGRALGNVVGMGAKGLGALAGGVAGAFDAAKKGYQAGKAQVGGEDELAPIIPTATRIPTDSDDSDELAPITPTATRIPTDSDDQLPMINVYGTGPTDSNDSNELAPTTVTAKRIPSSSDKPVKVSPSKVSSTKGLKFPIFPTNVPTFENNSNKNEGAIVSESKEKNIEEADYENETGSNDMKDLLSKIDSLYKPQKAQSSMNDLNNNYNSKVSASTDTKDDNTTYTVDGKAADKAAYDAAMARINQMGLPKLPNLPQLPDLNKMLKNAGLPGYGDDSDDSDELAPITPTATLIPSSSGDSDEVDVASPTEPEELFSKVGRQLAPSKDWFDKQEAPIDAWKNTVIGQNIKDMETQGDIGRDFLRKAIGMQDKSREDVDDLLKQARQLRQKAGTNESVKLDEWANEAGKDGTEAAFERDIEFMTKVIAGGLNKPKSTGQTTIPVIAHQDARTGDEDVAAWKKLAGLGK